MLVVKAWKTANGRSIGIASRLTGCLLGGLGVRLCRLESAPATATQLTSALCSPFRNASDGRMQRRLIALVVASQNTQVEPGVIVLAAGPVNRKLGDKACNGVRKFGLMGVPKLRFKWH